MQTRRVFLAAAGISVAGCASSPAVYFSEPGDEQRPPDAALPELAAIEQRIGGRLGVCAISGGRAIGHRWNERFAMASTFKWLLASAVLHKHTAEILEMDRTELSFRASDLLDYAPATRAAFDARGRGEGDARVASLTLAQLCEAAITVSDNTAANLSLNHIGGPAALTAYASGFAGGATRLDRMEPELNENAPGDARDTTTPFDMAQLLQEILLPVSSDEREPRAILLRWLNAATTGLDRLRAGLPPGWQAGDKTGTGGNGAHNDVAIVQRAAANDIVIASYISESMASNDEKAAAHAEVMRIAARELRY